MFRSVLVPLDGSPFAEYALPLAASVARRAGAPLRLAQVMHPLSDQFFWAPEPGDPLGVELRAQTRSRAQAYLEDAGRRLQGAGAVPVVCDVVEEGEGVAESIRGDVLRGGADLVVMTTHGRGALARSWLGSVADELARSLTVPLLLVRPGQEALDLGREVVLRHVLVALDGTPFAERVLGPAEALVRTMDADCTLVRAVPAAPASAGGVTVADRLRREADEYLQAVAGRLRAGGLRVQTRVAAGAQPAAAILQEAAGFDLVALESHGRGGLSRLLLGSVADKVVRGSEVPVLVCRAAG
jgi:nucleotide-binding universal stress UspA family protein